jgi:hypothetical protein
MAKTRAKTTDRDEPHIVDPVPSEPNCPRCKQTEFGSVQRVVGGNTGSFIYCTSCGCVVGWAPKSK